MTWNSQLMNYDPRLMTHDFQPTNDINLITMNEINLFVRENIRSLEAYSSARMESTLAQGLFLDANENPYGEYNRYPDPLQQALRQRLAERKGVSASQV